MAGKKSSKKKNKKVGIGVALWFLIALILLILFIVNWQKIASNLKSTGFFEKNNLKTPSFVENAETLPKDDSEEKNDVEPISQVQININDDELSLNSSTENSVTSQNELTFHQQELAQENAKKSDALRENSSTSSENSDVLSEQSQNQKSQSSSEKFTNSSEKSASSNSQSSAQKNQNQETKSVPATMNIKLYFMTINSNGTVSRKEVTRTMKKSDGPLVDSINALISGPTVEEENLGCRSLISNGTKLISASVKNGIATLNFSSEFEFNQYGIEGTQGQLQQIVFTATAFPTVESVQFLVDGEKKSYLGSEGVWIGTPLSRNSF